MNKNDLIAKISEQTSLTKADCQRIIEAAIEATKKCVRKGEEVRLVGFGTFVKAKRSARKGRNPQTGAEIQIKAHFVPKFRPGREFREFLG